jgi:hypothetical protein
MCEQCNADAVSFGEPIPGWFLMRARRDGIEWKQGDWGLVQSNDPSVTWTTTPTPSGLFGIEDEAEQEAWFEANRDTPAYARVWQDVPTDFQEAFRVTPDLGYDLVTAAKEKGYDPETSGFFVDWFFDLLGEHLKDAPMTEASPGALPERGPTNATIGRH